ncbi:MAG: DUF308 domain-containing protein [Eubacteriales bacterium]|nr:DUF308 domain-containing protein [Eubacteriales bacterium]
MLFEVLDKLKQQTIISSILMMMLGLLMLIVPEKNDWALVNILGYVIIIIGAVMVWDFIAGDKHLSSCILFIFALLLILLGIFILVSGDDILKVLSVLFGILLMIDGLHSGLHAWMYARRAGRKWWGLLIVLSVLLFGAGIIILNNPWWHTAHSFVKVIGAVILFAAATGIVRLILVWPIRKE